MSILNRITGVENMLNEPEVNSTEGEVAIEAVRAELAEVIADVNEVAGEVQGLSQELAEHEETVEELAEEVAGMESMLSGAVPYSAGGFAASFNRATRLNAKLGGDNVSRVGVESLSDASSAQLAAHTGTESFMATVKNGAAKAAEFIKAIFNHLLTFFVGLVSTASGLESRSKQLKAKVDGAEKLKEKIKLGGWNVGVDYAKNGADILDKGPWTKVLSDSLPAFIEIGKNLDGVNEAGFKSAYSTLIADIKAVVKESAGAPTEKSGADDKRNVLASRAGFAVYLAYNDKFGDEKEVLAAARSVKLSFGKTEGAKEFAKGEEVAVKATKPQLVGLLNTVNTVASLLRDSKISQKFSKAERDRVVATLANKAKEGGDKSAQSKAIELVRALYSTGSTLTTQVNKLLTAQAKQALDLVAAHV